MSNGSFPCPACGYVLEPQFRFCPSCGTPNQPPAPAIVAPATELEAATNEDQVAGQSAPAVVEDNESVDLSVPAAMPETDAAQEQYETWQMPPVTEQAEAQEESQAGTSEAPYVDFASLFGYGSQEEEVPMQNVAQVEQPVPPVEVEAAEEALTVMEASPIVEAQPPAGEEERLVAEDRPQVVDEGTFTEGIAEIVGEPAPALVTERQSPATGPLPDLPDLSEQVDGPSEEIASPPDIDPAGGDKSDEAVVVASQDQPIEEDTPSQADFAPDDMSVEPNLSITAAISSHETSEVGYSPANSGPDIESEHTPAAPYTEVPPVEAISVPATEPLEIEPVYEPTPPAPAYEAVQHEPDYVDLPEQLAQPEPVYSATAYEVMQPEPVDEQPAYEPVQQEPISASEQPEVISFSELFSWPSTDDTGDNAPTYTPPEESAQAQEKQQDIYAPPASWEQATGEATTSYDEPEPSAEATTATVFTFVYSTPQGHEEGQREAATPSWKPGDEPASATQPQQTVGPAQPTNPAYQSYAQSAPLMAAAPPPVQPAMPPPGQRPKPGTPEYEEMARRAMEQRLSGAPATTQADTSPLGTPSYTSPTPTPPYGYTPEPMPQAAQPPPPVQPAMPPPSQRPKPGTPEYEEMARRAMEQRGAPSISTSPLGTIPQPTQPTYSPEPAAPPTSPVQPEVPPPGQRPKPGTPEYEEMARRAMEERQRQQGR